MYYFDHAATTRVLPIAAQAAMECMTQHYGNPSSLHSMGAAAEKIVTNSRRQLAQALKCRQSEVYFTSGATESNNIALFGTAKAKRHRGKTIITTQIEHASVSHTMKELEKQGFTVISIAPREGKYCARDFADTVDDQTILLSCMYVNNETGLLLPVEEIIQKAKQKNPNIIVHIDAVQAFCKLPFHAKKMGADLISISAHKIHGMKGVGALYVKDGFHLPNRTFGGGHERGVRPGTEAVPAIASFGAAAQYCYDNMPNHFAHFQELNCLLKEALMHLPEISFNSSQNNVPYIFNFSIQGVLSEVMLHFLESKGFCVSSGSACSKGAKSGVLPALGFSRQREDTAVRVSFSFENTKEQTLLLAKAVEQGLQTLVGKK